MSHVNVIATRNGLHYRLDNGKTYGFSKHAAKLNADILEFDAEFTREEYLTFHRDWISRSITSRAWKKNWRYVQESMEYLAEHEPIDAVRMEFSRILDLMRPFFGSSINVSVTQTNEWKRQIGTSRHCNVMRYQGPRFSRRKAMMCTGKFGILPDGIVGNEEKPCALCTNVHDGLRFKIPECKHDFHLCCIDQWTAHFKGKMEPSCPVCLVAKYDPLN